MQPQMVLIDLDGTLVDSVPDLAFCVDETRRRLGQPPHGEAKVRQWVGNGVERLVKRSILGQLDGEPEETAFKQAYPIFIELYARHNGEHSQLYPGVAEGLIWLKQHAYRLGCVTNKAEQFTLPLLRQLGIIDYFELIISGDTLPKQKPDPLPLLHAAQFFGVKPANALMIGDSVSDVKAARAAGFRIVCVSYGYNHGQDIRLAQPDAVIDSLAEFPQLMSNQ